MAAADAGDGDTTGGATWGSTCVAKTASQQDGVAVSATMDAFALAHSALEGSHWLGSVELYDLADDTGAGELEPRVGQYLEESGGVTCVRWAGPGRLAFGCDNGEVRVAERADAEADADEPYVLGVTNTLGAHGDSVTCIDCAPGVAGTPGNLRVLSASADCMVRLWSVDGASATSTAYEGHSDAVTGVSWNACAPASFVTCSMDYSVRLWAAGTETPTSVLRLSGPALCVEWEPTAGNLIAVGAESGQVTVYDTRVLDRGAMHSRRPRDACVYSLAFSSAAPGVLASGADDKSIVLGDVNAGEAPEETELLGHTDYVRGLAWAGTRLLSAGWDCQTLMWARTDADMKVAPAS